MTWKEESSLFTRKHAPGREERRLLDEGVRRNTLRLGSQGREDCGHRSLQELKGKYDNFYVDNSEASRIEKRIQRGDQSSAVRSDSWAGEKRGGLSEISEGRYSDLVDGRSRVLH